MDLDQAAVIALVGNPNSGKTTLFNTLTGLNYKVANYPGVTVESKEGEFYCQERKIKLVDLPGTYSLNGHSPEEKLTLKELTTSPAKFDLLLLLADATNLERNLLVITEALELGYPAILALTMCDLASKNKLIIRELVLAQKLGIKIIKINAKTGSGLDQLKEEISKSLKINSELSTKRRITNTTTSENQNKRTAQNPEEQLELTTQRYQSITKLLENVVLKKQELETRISKIDYILSHRIYGLIIFAALMFIMFQSVFNLAAWPMDLIEAGISTIRLALSDILPNGAVKSLVLDGILAGIGSILIFIPQIALLFMFIGVMEDSGYLTRASFLLDGFMRKIGLQGRSFIPLLGCFACAVPGIMSTRTIASAKDRIITILIAPLMSCSARLPVYALLIAAFIPSILIFKFIQLQGLVLFLLYFAGTSTALILSWIASKFLIKGESSYFIYELPALHVPSFKFILYQVIERVLIFVKNAGTFILTCSIILWFLAYYPHPIDNSIKTSDIELRSEQLSESVKNSYAGQIGQLIEPIMRPLGFNWEISVSILASFAAREVFVSSMATVYNLQSTETTTQNLGDILKNSKDLNLPAALSLLVFYVFACQCMSTLAVCKRETNSWRWPIIMFSYMTILAYMMAFATYRISSYLLL